MSLHLDYVIINNTKFTRKHGRRKGSPMGERGRELNNPRGLWKAGVEWLRYYNRKNINKKYIKSPLFSYIFLFLAFNQHAIRAFVDKNSNYFPSYINMYLNVSFGVDGGTRFPRTANTHNCGSQ